MDSLAAVKPVRLPQPQRCSFPPLQRFRQMDEDTPLPRTKVLKALGKHKRQHSMKRIRKYEHIDAHTVDDTFRLESYFLFFVPFLNFSNSLRPSSVYPGQSFYRS